MYTENIVTSNGLKGVITIPGDKSISHRTIMFGALASGTTEVYNLLQSSDCLATIDCFQKLGIEINNHGSTVKIHGKGLDGLTKPGALLDVGNSGTTLRIISGILAAQNFESILNGDQSIQVRPMRRIIDPLSLMGANIISMKNNGCAPIKILGQPLKGISYISNIASAQIKSAILMAGLYADGATSVTEPSLSRNHTELMLQQFGGSIQSRGTTVVVESRPKLEAQKIVVPGDISSAAYFIVAGLVVPNSEIVIKDVGINPTRDGILRVISKMGGDIQIENKKTSGKEETADIVVRSSQLNGITIGGNLIPTLIDELPIIAVLSCFAKGTTIIKDAQELKVKETNRIEAMVQNLSAMQAKIQGTEDGMIIEGGHPLYGAAIDSKYDHRIAMSLSIAGLQANGITTIQNSNCVNVSYPNFYETLNSLKACL